MKAEIKHATKEDLKKIVAIYNASIPSRLATADTKEVTTESKLEWFERHTPDKRPIMVYTIDREIVAWFSFEPFYGRPAYDQTAELSIYIAAEYQGKGIGKKLMETAISMTHNLGIKTLLGNIFSHNEASIRLFKSFGFEEWGQFPNIAEMDNREYSLSILGKRVNP